MFEIAKLELRKNRILFFGMGGTLLGSVPFSAAVAVLNGHPAMLGVDSMLFFWSFLGLPLIACLFGASGGAVNGADPVESAEIGLPISVERRAFAAVAGICVQVLVLSLLFLLLASLVSAQWRETLILVGSPNAPWSRVGEEPALRPLFFAGLTLLPFYAASTYAFAAWIRNGILGGFVGMVSVAVFSLALAGGMALEAIYKYRAPFGGKAALLIVFGFLALSWGIRELSRWLGRRENRRMAWAGGVAVALIAGTIGSLGAVSTTWSSVNRSLNFKGRTWLGYSYTDIPSVAARGSMLQGALAASKDGGLYFVKPDGTRKSLLPATGRSLMQVVRSGPSWGVDDVHWDDEGDLWVTRSVPGRDGEGTRHEIWTGTISEGLRYHAPLSGWLRPIVRRGSQLGFLSWNSKFRLFAPIPAKGMPLQWVEIKKDEEEFLREGYLESGLAGRLSQEGRSFTATMPGGKRKTWRLPARAIAPQAAGGIVPAIRSTRGNFFVLNISNEEHGSRIVRLNDDGSVSTVIPYAPGGWPRLRSTARGGLWLTENGRLHAMTPEGEFLPSTELQALYGAHPPEEYARGYYVQPYHVVRVEKARVFVVAGDGTLVTLEAGSGRILKEVRLPASAMLNANMERAFQAVEKGFFFHTGLRLHFVEWNGTVSDLGKA